MSVEICKGCNDDITNEYQAHLCAACSVAMCAANELRNDVMAALAMDCNAETKLVILKLAMRAYNAVMARRFLGKDEP